MSLLVRKIEIAKWRKNGVLQGELPSADAVTGCMRTSSNTLSLWSINSDDERDDAVLAIAGGMQHLESIDVLWIDDALIEQKGLPIVKSPEAGRTAYEGFRERHRDVVDLDYWSLGYMAEVVIETIRMNCCKRYTKADLKRIVTSAVATGKVRWWDLERRVRRETPYPTSEINDYLAQCVAQDEFDLWRTSLTDKAKSEMTQDNRAFRVIFRREGDGMALVAVDIEKDTGAVKVTPLADAKPTVG